jgi:hypothetical protein
MSCLFVLVVCYLLSVISYLLSVNGTKCDLKSKIQFSIFNPIAIGSPFSINRRYRVKMNY